MENFASEVGFFSWGVLGGSVKGPFASSFIFQGSSKGSLITKVAESLPHMSFRVQGRRVGVDGLPRVSIVVPFLA